MQDKVIDQRFPYPEDTPISGPQMQDAAQAQLERWLGFDSESSDLS